MSSRIHVPLTEVKTHPLILTQQQLEEMRRARVQTWRHTREENAAWCDGFKAGATAVGIPALFVVGTLVCAWMGW